MTTILSFLIAVLPLTIAASPGPRNATVLIIRHADKSDAGDGLSPAGLTRANACVAYFQHFTFRSTPVNLNAIFAAADSSNSRRPRLTVEPVAQALGLAVNTRYKHRDTRQLADALHRRLNGKNALVCWHHGEIPSLLEALGADPGVLLPGGRWPEDEYGLVIVLRFDANGDLAAAQREAEPF